MKKQRFQIMELRYIADGSVVELTLSAAGISSAGWEPGGYVHVSNEEEQQPTVPDPGIGRSVEQRLTDLENDITVLHQIINDMDR